MKKNILISIGLLFSFLIWGQTLTVPTSLTQVNVTDLTANMWEEFTNWTLSGQLIPVSSQGGNSTFTITDDWNPTNPQLNEIETVGGNTFEWPLYLAVNDSTFFTEEILGTLNGNSHAVYGRYTEPLRDWGTYFKETHLIYFYEATNPDQYIILGAKENGVFMDLSTIRDIVAGYAQCIGYRTQVAIDAISTKVHRDDW